MGAARKGLAALVIEWDEGPLAKLTAADIAVELEEATRKSGSLARNIGDVDKAMASAVTKVDAEYHVPFLAHATLEPMNCTVHVRKDGCEVGWDAAIDRYLAAAGKPRDCRSTGGLPHTSIGGGRPTAGERRSRARRAGCARSPRRLRGGLQHAINPDTVRAQIEGAIIFGVTAALHGGITLKDGRVEQSDFHDYQMLRISEAPAIEVYIVQSSEPPGGMGEAGTSVIVPAVTNAILRRPASACASCTVDAGSCTAGVKPSRARRISKQLLGHKRAEESRAGRTSTAWLPAPAGTRPRRSRPSQTTRAFHRRSRSATCTRFGVGSFR